MRLPEPQSSPVSTLISDIEKGMIKIPQFQRDFVWDLTKSADLMDSIVKGYPIGTFIFWKTKERLRSIRNIGGVKLPEPVKKTGCFVSLHSSAISSYFSRIVFEGYIFIMFSPF